MRSNTSPRVPFVMLPVSVITDVALHPGLKSTLAALLHFARGKTLCYPGRETLARHVGCSVRSITTYTHSLAAMGYITIIHRGKMKTNVYRLHDLHQSGLQTLQANETQSKRKTRTTVRDTHFSYSLNENPRSIAGDASRIARIIAYAERLPSRRRSPLLE
jgi:hypothetical protein